VGSGRYGAKHNPAAYYVGGSDRDECEIEDVPLGTTAEGRLAEDLEDRKLPSFSMIIPDLCNDTHDCPVKTGDEWLRGWVARLTSSPEYHDGKTAIFIVWDEPTPMPFFAIAPSVAAGSTTGQAVDHYALLRTTEEMLGLPTTLGAASTAPSLRPLLHL
jgi:phospholipase C